MRAEGCQSYAQIKVRVPRLKGPDPNVTHNHKTKTRGTGKS